MQFSLFLLFGDTKPGSFAILSLVETILILNKKSEWEKMSER